MELKFIKHFLKGSVNRWFEIIVFSILQLLLLVRQLSRRLVLTLFLLLGINDARCSQDDKTSCFLYLSSRFFSSIFTNLGAVGRMPCVRMVACSVVRPGAA